MDALYTKTLSQLKTSDPETTFHTYLPTLASSSRRNSTLTSTQNRTLLGLNITWYGTKSCPLSDQPEVNSSNLSPTRSAVPEISGNPTINSAPSQIASPVIFTLWTKQSHLPREKLTFKLFLCLLFLRPRLMQCHSSPPTSLNPLRTSQPWPL